MTVSDTATVACPKTKIKVLLQYMEESWLGKTQNKVEGVVFKYDPNNDNKTKIRDVSEKDVLARIEGCWHDKIYYSLGGKPLNKADVWRPFSSVISFVRANNFSRRNIFS